MARVKVSTTIDAPPKVVWAQLRDIGSHVEWMADAVAIRFVSDRTEGIGTAFECDTKVGPFRMTDQMVCTEWREAKVMGMRHVGVVEGTGRFTLERKRGGRTRFTWKEKLSFPWWMGGPFGGIVGGRILRRIWKRNLRLLKATVEGRA